MKDVELELFLAEMRDKRLATLKPLLEGTVKLLQSLSGGLELNAALRAGANSPFERELNQLAKPGAVRCLHRTVWLARYGAFASLDHARTMTVLLRLEGGVLAPVVVARAALEAGARTSWLLDEHLNGRERVGRTFAYRYNCADFQQSVDTILGVVPGDTDDTMERIVLEATESGIMVEGRSFENQKHKSETKIVEDFVALSGYENVRASYGVLSAVTHARPLGALLLMEGRGHMYEDPLTVFPEHDLPPLSGAIYSVLFAIMASFSRLFTYLGFEGGDWWSWHDTVGDILRGPQEPRRRTTARGADKQGSTRGAVVPPEASL